MTELGYTPRGVGFRSVVVLSGGVGGAKLVDGLAQVLEPDALTVVVNTGDDLEHWGLYVCPDLDTVLYTLAGRSDDARGWGLKDESFRTLAQMSQLGCEAWFALGDQDLATHLYRTDALRGGLALSATTASLCARLGVSVPILPMSELPRRTFIHTDAQGRLPFQRWFVQHRAEPIPTAITFEGSAEPCPQVLEALDRAELVIIAPSNPYVSIDPILSLSGLRGRVQSRLVVAVSPLIGGQAVKGPLAKMMKELTGAEASSVGIARHYGAILNGLLVDPQDERTWPDAGTDSPVKLRSSDILMRDRPDRVRLAQEVLSFAEELRVCT